MRQLALVAQSAFALGLAIGRRALQSLKKVIEPPLIEETVSTAPS